MNVAIRHPVMTRAQFFLWAEAQEERYEFDGFVPVAMGGGTNRHSRIVINILVALADRLRGSGCALASGDVLRIPEVGIEIPVDDCYESVEFT